ncbi:hypothetical protein WN990_16045 [Kitasatospora purpeofusca]|uniref:hypothetical protein n=1 Tax=Kitasatospora purpeofusca TaxID=67352 RepID=UPI0030F09526
MQPAVVASLIASGVALVTSGVTAVVSWRNTRAQSREARRAQIDTARRNYQRGAYADLVSSTWMYLRTTAEVLPLARRLEENASAEGLRDAQGSQVHLTADMTKGMREKLEEVWSSHAVAHAAVLVDLEGPPAVAQRAAEVQQQAGLLMRALFLAGLAEDSAGQAATAFDALNEALNAFLKAAQEHLSSHL